ncbi:restriction endonuclease subunit S [Vibrio splendidus]
MSVDIESLITEKLDIWSLAIEQRKTTGRGSSRKINAYGVQKLRELILELAVRGKLIEQDSNDEPSTVLLEKIAEEKAQLIKDKAIKRQKALPAISAEEKLFDLPDGWEWVRLQDISTYIQRGKGPKYAESGEVKVISQKCIQWTGFVSEPARFIDSETLEKYQPERFIKKGDLLWNSTGTGTVGRINSVNFEPKNQYVADSHVTVIRLVDFVESDFITTYISAPGVQNRINPEHPNSLVSGTTKQVELNASSVASLLVPIAPKSEQSRISARVSELLQLCDQLEQQVLTNLDLHQELVGALLATLTNSKNSQELYENWSLLSEHFNSLFITEKSIESLKKTILQLAVTGKLVKQNPDDESASVFLECVALEKDRLIKEKIIKRQKALSLISDDEKSFELPNGWEWCRISEIACIGTGATPSRTNPAFYSPAEYPWVASGETSEEFIFSTKEKISQLAVEKTNVTIYPKGTLIVAMYGQGKTRGQITELMIDAGTNQACAAIQLIDKCSAHRDYVKLFFKKSYEDLRTLASGGAQPNLNVSKVSGTVLPLPPVQECKRIKEKVASLFDLCDQLAQQIKAKEDITINICDSLIEHQVGKTQVAIELDEKKVMSIFSKISLLKTDFEEINSPLATLLLKNNHSMDARALWEKSQLSLPKFYLALKNEIEQGIIAKPEAAEFSEQ